MLFADIQGAELAMLEGAAKSIDAGRVRWAVISTHHECISLDPDTHGKCLTFIRARGGHVIAEYPAADSYSGDGLIAASFDPRDRHGLRLDYLAARNGIESVQSAMKHTGLWLGGNAACRYVCTRRQAEWLQRGRLLSHNLHRLVCELGVLDEVLDEARERGEDRPADKLPDESR